MALVTTPAIVLATWRYRETSKVLRLATREHGVQSAIARGALRPKSRFGAALEVLSEGDAQFLLRDNRDMHPLIAFDVTRVRLPLTTGMGRYAAAMVLAELMVRFAPADWHPELFDCLQDSLNALEAAAEPEVEAAGLRRVWGLVSELGFAPVLAACARDGAPIPGGALHFSIAEGGAVCATCARGAATAVLAVEDRADLAALLDPGATLPALDQPHAMAHRRLLHRYVHQHLGEGARLPALEFWLRQAWHAA
jgi:DNA repair protein RecO (recombination protein O)